MKTLPYNYGLIALSIAAWCWATTPCRAAEYQDHVVIVLDASGSMAGKLAGTNMDKMSAAKQALKTVLQQLPPSTHIGLLVFSAKNVSDPWIYPLGPRHNDQLVQAIDRPEPKANTPLGKFIKIGADRLLQARQDQYGYGTYRLLIVTDGEAQDQNLVQRYVPEVVARGITVDVIGVDMSQDHTLATQVHSYRRANDPESLQRAVAEVLAEVARPSSDTAQAEEFALLAPFTPALATAAIEALSTSGNQPIGDSGQNREVQSTSNNSPPSAPQPAPPPHRTRRGVFGFFTWILMGVVLLVIIQTIFRRRR